MNSPSTSPLWDGTQYDKFARQRSAACADLVAHIPLSPDITRAADLGCGTGSSTALLAEHLRDISSESSENTRHAHHMVEILGLDSSEEMLCKARAKHPALRFERADIRHALSEPCAWDVLLANASLQWLDDHAGVLSAWMRALRPGGTLAVQIPTNDTSPLYRAIHDVVRLPEWGWDVDALTAFHTVHPPETYADILSRLTPRFEVWQTTYFHRLDGFPALLEWVRGTRLLPYLQRLDAAGRERLLRLLSDRAAPFYPPMPSGEILFRFRRLFFTAQKV